MRLIRFGYLLPVSLLILFSCSFIAYATITWDNQDSSVWYGPNMPYNPAPLVSYNSATGYYTTNDTCSPLQITDTGTAVVPEFKAIVNLEEEFE